MKGEILTYWLDFVLQKRQLTIHLSGPDRVRWHHGERRVTFRGPWTDTVQARKPKNSVQIWNFLFFTPSMLCWGILISEYLAAVAGTVSIYIKVLWRIGEFIPSPQKQEYVLSNGCHLWNLTQLLEPPQVQFKFSAAAPPPSLPGMPPHSQNTLTQIDPRSP